MRERMDRHSPQPHMARQRPTLNILFVGNPGVGKSTLLNSMLDEIVFESGPTTGRGLTRHLQRRVGQDGVCYMDTPGLHDAASMKKAADEIAAAFRQGGKYKVVFVVTTDSGRIRHTDQALMKLVLEAVPVVGKSYGLIFNRMSAAVVRLYEEKWMECLAMFLHGLPQPRLEQVCCVLEDETIPRDAMCALVQIPDLFAYLDRVPEVEILPRQVRNLDIDRWERVTAELRRTCQQLERNNSSLQSEIASLRDQVRNADRGGGGGWFCTLM